MARPPGSPEIPPFDHGWGREFAAGAGGEADAIEKEVVRAVYHEWRTRCRLQLVRRPHQDAR
jgi:hypothetical protein